MVSRKYKKVIIVSEFVDPVSNSTGYYWHKIIQGINESVDGICLEVLCTDSSYAKLENIKSGIRYRTFKNSSANGKKIFGRIVKQIVQTFNLFHVFRKVSSRGDIVFSGTNPSFMLLLFSFLKMIIGFRWVLLVHDVFPNNLLAANILKDRSLSFFILTFVFRRVYRSADQVISIGRDMSDVLRNKGVDECKITFIPNWVDLKEFKFNLQRNYDELYGVDCSSKVVFQFFGNIGRVQGIDSYLKVIDGVKSSKAIFVFIGNGANVSNVKEFIEGRQKKNVLYFDAVPFAQNNKYLNACDVSVVCLSKGMAGLGVPSKAYFSMAVDKPLLIIGDGDSELALLLKEHPDVGWICAAGDVDASIEVIEKICEENLELRRGKPMGLMRSEYNYSVAVEKYAALVKKLL